MTDTTDTTARQQRGVRLIEHQGMPGETVRELSEVVSIIGSGDGCDVVVTGPRVAEAHAAIVLLDETAYVCDLGAAGGTQLNGRRIRWTRLGASDAITIGDSTFVVEVDEATEYAVAEQPFFRLSNEREVGTISSIDPVLVVGRAASCDVVLDNACVAKRHCLVTWTRMGPVVRALSADHATRVNGRRVTLAHLNNGDRIGVGPVELKFEAGLEYADTTTDEPSVIALESAPEMEEPATDPSPLVAGSLPVEALASVSDLWRPVQIPVAGKEQTSMTPSEPCEATTPAAPARSMPLAKSGGGAVEVASAEARLRQKTSELRTRVTAAQAALDERARRYREKIQEERQRLDMKKAELRRQAKTLVDMARRNREAPAADAAYASFLNALALSDDGIADRSASELMEIGLAQFNVDDLLGGTIELSDLTAASGERTPREPGAVDASAVALGEIEARLAHVLAVARAEREEMERGCELAEMLQSEAARQHEIVAARQQTLQSRKGALEDRFKAFEKARDRIRRERAPLLAKLRQLESEEAYIKARVAEGECQHQEVVNEVEQLGSLQERLETRERELMYQLEQERRRLHVRQQQLQRTAARLAATARERRLMLETGVAQRQREIEEREQALEARRLTWEIADSSEGTEAAEAEMREAARLEIEKIEADLAARRRDLEAKRRELTGEKRKPATMADLPQAERPMRGIAEELIAFRRMMDAGHESSILDEMQREIDAFSGISASNGVGPGGGVEHRTRTIAALSDEIQSSIESFGGALRAGEDGDRPAAEKAAEAKSERAQNKSACEFAAASTRGGEVQA